MIPVVCRVKHDADVGTYGDCVRACVASIMELDAEAVPHFYHDNCDGGTGFDRINAFVGQHGLATFTTAYSGDDTLAELLATMGEQNPTAVYMLFGRTASGGSHVVVCRGGQIVHDPAWSRSPLIAPTSAGCWIVMVLARV